MLHVTNIEQKTETTWREMELWTRLTETILNINYSGIIRKLDDIEQRYVFGLEY